MRYLEHQRVFVVFKCAVLYHHTSKSRSKSNVDDDEDDGDGDEDDGERQ